MSALDNLLDVLRLEVEQTQVGLRNLIANPSGRKGAWGWQTSIGILVRQQYLVGLTPNYDLRFSNAVTGAGSEVGPQSEDIPVTPGNYIRAGYTVRTSGGSSWVRMRLRYYNADGTLNSSTAYTALTTGAHSANLAALLIPAGAASVRMSFEVWGNAAGTDNTKAKLFEWRNAWINTATTAAGLAAAVYSDPITWVPVLGSSTTVSATRRTFDGNLAVTVRDATLDPADNEDVLTPGHRVRLLVVDAGESTGYTEIWTGKIIKPTVDYGDLKRNARPTISVTATGPGGVLTGVPRPNGYAHLAELPELLEGIAMPYNINGAVSPDPLVVPAVVSSNESATALDQIILARDSELGYAWIDREGVLRGLTDRTDDPYGATLELDESNYSTLAYSFDPETCINVVSVTLLRFNSSTGETEEVPYGPYVNTTSREKWGEQPREFRVHGVDPSTFAAAVLAANADPVRRVEKLRIPVRDTTDLLTIGTADLYQFAHVVNTAKGIDITQRILGVDHSIDTAKRHGHRGRWYVDLLFGAEDSVATPIATTPAAQASTTKDGVWNAWPFTGAWVNFGSTWETAGYMRKNGVVYLRGLVKGGSVAVGSVIGTLPAGFRPSSDKHVVTEANGTFAILNIMATGVVKINTASSNLSLSLANITFPAEL